MSLWKKKHLVRVQPILILLTLNRHLRQKKERGSNLRFQRVEFACPHAPSSTHVTSTITWSHMTQKPEQTKSVSCVEKPFLGHQAQVLRRNCQNTSNTVRDLTKSRTSRTSEIPQPHTSVRGQTVIRFSAQTEWRKLIRSTVTKSFTNVSSVKEYFTQNVRWTFTWTNPWRVFWHIASKDSKYFVMKLHMKSSANFCYFENILHFIFMEIVEWAKLYLTCLLLTRQLWPSRKTMPAAT